MVPAARVFFGEFRPVQKDADGDGTDFVNVAGGRFQMLHDGFDVLCQVGTNDNEEIRIQSFMFGQFPFVEVAFLGASFQATPHLPRYKHWMDIRDAMISREDFERGTQTELLVLQDFAPLWSHPIAELRKRFDTAPRTSAERSLQISVVGRKNFFGGRARTDRKQRQWA